MLKRTFDLLVSALALISLWPILLTVALAVKMGSPGPVFYRAVRVGRYGKPFRMYKFRSMVSDSSGAGPVVTRDGDPRITAVGRMLRKTKVDELPQLINVFWGDMSIVGPRPEDPRFVACYTPEQHRVLSVRPGLASPATIKYRDEERLLAAAGGDVEDTYVRLVLPDKLRIDLEYVDQRSLLGDLTVLAELARPVLSRVLGRQGRPTS